MQALTPEIQPLAPATPLALNDYKLSSSGKNEKQWKLSTKFSITKIEQFPKELRYPLDIVVANKGDQLWIAHYGKNELSKFQFTTGTYVTYNESQTNLLSGALGVAVNPADSDDHVYVSCQHSQKLLKVNAITHTLYPVITSGLRSPRGQSFTSKGDLYLTQLERPHLLKFKASYEKEWGKSFPPSDGIWTTKVNPRNDSEVFISYYNSSCLIKLVNGVAKKKWTTAATIDGQSEIGNLGGMCFYENHLFVTDRRHRVIRILDLATREMDTLDFTFQAAAENGSELLCITVDPLRKLFYISGDFRVYKMHFIDVSKLLFKQFPPRFSGDIKIQPAN